MQIKFSFFNLLIIISTIFSSGLLWLSQRNCSGQADIIPVFIRLIASGAQFFFSFKKGLNISPFKFIRILLPQLRFHNYTDYPDLLPAPWLPHLCHWSQHSSAEFSERLSSAGIHQVFLY